VREVFKNILPNILMSSGPTYATIPAHKLATREYALAFVTYVMSRPTYGLSIVVTAWTNASASHRDFAKDVKEMESRQRRKSGTILDLDGPHALFPRMAGRGCASLTLSISLGLLLLLL
jgi:hypothetical protein